MTLPNIDWETSSNSYPIDLCELFIEFILEFHSDGKFSYKRKEYFGYFLTNRASLVSL